MTDSIDKAHAGATEGARLKEQQLDCLRELRAVYVRRGQRLLVERLLRHETGSIDNVRDNIDIPSNVNPTCLGAVPGTLAKAGIIERVGFRNTDHPKGHARPVSVWTLRRREKAIRWLAEHPELDGVCAASNSGNGGERRQQELFPVH